MKCRSSSRSHNGVTLVEMLITVAILGVVLAVAVPSFSDMIERRRVIAAAGEIANIFTYARSEANVLADKLTIHMEPVPSSVGDYSCIRVSTAKGLDTCQCDVAKACAMGKGVLLREFVLPRDKSVSFKADGVWVPDRLYRVGFLRDTHMTDVQDVQVTVTGARTSAELRVEYNNAGRVRICSPSGTIGGFPVCG
jgi:type IV fimbrial biogenesis protein FimT